jgi:cell division protein FtsB
MAKLQRISNLEKYAVVGIAAFVDTSHLFMAVVQEIPVAGIAFVVVDYGISFLSFFGFLAWYIKVGIGTKRMWMRIGLNLLLLFLQLFVSGIPYGGPIVAAFIMLFFTINTYLLIRSVQKEDVENNKKLEAQAQKLTQEAQQKVRGYTRKV